MNNLEKHIKTFLSHCAGWMHTTASQQYWCHRGL